MELKTGCAESVFLMEILKFMTGRGFSQKRILILLSGVESREGELTENYNNLYYNSRSNYVVVGKKKSLLLKGGGGVSHCQLCLYDNDLLGTLLSDSPVFSLTFLL